MAFAHSNMQSDELAALLARNLSFNPIPEPTPVPQQESKTDHAEPIIYTSVHYTHSAHIAQAAQHQEIPRRSSEPPQTQAPSVEAILQYHGINPATLTPSQLQLFKVAEPAQQERLVELWNICPPGNGGDIPALAWSSTTVEHEEQLARLRYDRLNQQQVMSLDGTQVQANDGRWVRTTEPEMEPYMASGYEELMRREREREARDSQPRSTYGLYSHATDPAYMGPDYARDQQLLQMATQYGAYQGFRAPEADTMDVM